MNGYFESQHQLEERKQRIQEGTYGRRGSETVSLRDHEALERMYAQLRTIVLKDMLEKLEGAVARMESVS